MVDDTEPVVARVLKAELPKGQKKLKAELARCRFSQNTNEIFLICLM